MKKIIITFLVTIICNNAFAMNENKEVTLTQPKVQANSTINKDLIKGIAGLAGACIFGYLSYECHVLHHSPKLLSSANERNAELYIPANLNFVDRILIHLSQNLKYPLYKWIAHVSSEKTDEYEDEYFDENYLYHNLGIILNAIAAFQCAQYGTSKLYSALASKELFIKQKLSLIKNYLAKIKRKQL